MFTGIIHCMGAIAAVAAEGGDVRLTIAAPDLDTTRIAAGDSIAVNGVCLTAVNVDAKGFTADVSQETLSLTTLGDMQAGGVVNIEPSLTLATPLGGHLVSGHIDGMGTVASLAPDARSTRMEFEIPRDLMRYLVRKGSVAIDGTSLTVNQVAEGRISVNIVPHTLEKTIMGTYAPGTRVNIEVDQLARYLERLLQEQQ